LQAGAIGRQQKRLTTAW